MMTSRLCAMVLAGSFITAPVAAGEFTGYQYFEITAPTSPGCRAGTLLNLPASWQAEDGAVILLTLGQPHDTARDVLVSAILAEHAAVLEVVPPACDGMQGRREGVIAGALGALDAMTRTAGAGLVVAIGYGRGSTAVLDVVREPTAGLLGANGPRYAAAVAIGDGAPAFALGGRAPAREQAPPRLAALCRALAAIAGGMGATPERAAPAAAAEPCVATLAEETSLAATPQPVMSRR